MPAEFLTCFACEQEPTQQCPRCGRPYCNDHGEDVCDVCLQPSSGLPSFTLYRGSLLALLIGTALAVWLLVQPPGSKSSAPGPLVLSPTPLAARQTTPSPQTTQAAATQPAGATPQATQSAGASPPPGATPTPRPTGTPASGSGGTGRYTVASGDTLSSICERVKPASMTVPECVDRVVALNSLSDPNDISVGQELIVPR